MDDNELARAVLYQAKRTGTYYHVICKRAQVHLDTLDRIRDGKTIKRPVLLKLVAALGMKLDEQGELDWDDSLSAAVAQPAAQRDVHLAYRQQVYEFLRGWMPQFHGEARKVFLMDALDRRLITPFQLEELLDCP
jgi:hypothetical protein